MKAIKGPDIPLNLRERAEKILNTRNIDLNSPNQEMIQLFQELQVYQIELEMQNEQLQLAAQELDRETNKFFNLFNFSPVGYFILRTDGIIDSANTAALDLLHCKKKLLPATRFSSYIEKSDTDIFYHFLHKIKNNGKKQVVELKLIDANGNLIYTHIEGIMILDSLTNKSQFYLAVVDISDRKQTEKNLEEIKNRLEITLSSTGLGAFEFYPKSQKVYMDEFCCSIFGIDHAFFDGNYQSFLDFIEETDRTRIVSEIQEAIKLNKQIDTEFKIIKTRQAAFYISLRGRMVIMPNKEKRLVGVLMDITRKKMLEEEAIQLKINQQKNITTAILQTQEKERTRISEGLHDSVSQLLYGITLHINNMKTEDNMDEIQKIRELVTESIKQTRNISFELAPSILNDYGLTVALKEIACRLTTDNFRIILKSNNTNKRFPIDLELTIFRIVQEIVNNCLKHSKAKELSIKITESAGGILIETVDNGIGFNYEKKIDKGMEKGSGLSSIKNRVYIFNGTFNLESSPEKGTKISIFFPTI